MGEAEAKPKRAKAGFVLALIGGILILIRALYIASRSLAMIETITEMLTDMGLGAYTYLVHTLVPIIVAVGLLSGFLVIVGSLLIYMPGKEVIGGITVLLFSILGIIGGGGFIIGTILGIIGGILGIKRR